MYSAKDIAFSIVNRGIADGKPVTQMQLQKMLYFANGIHLAKGKGPLLKDKFQAWRFGPVIPSIYDIYKLYGSDKINHTIWLTSGLGYGGIHKPVELDSDTLETINITWNTLKDIDAIKLSNWTHQSGSPWEKAYQYGENTIINEEDMKVYFDQFMTKKDANGAAQA